MQALIFKTIVYIVLLSVSCVVVPLPVGNKFCVLFVILYLRKIMRTSSPNLAGRKLLLKFMHSMIGKK